MIQESNQRAEEIDPFGGPRRLVRDPTARLGGVASGLAHYYGVDAALVRIGFIVFTLFSGVGAVAYLLAWIAVPRSDYWPPVHSQLATGVPPKLSNRDVFLAFAILLALASVGRVGPSWGAPLLLIFAGVWLLHQQAVPEAPAPSGPLAGFSTALIPESESVTGSVPVLVSRRRRRGLMAVLIGLFVLPLAAIIAVFVGFATEQIDFDVASRIVAPGTVDDIPFAIELDAGEIVIDLRELDPADFDTTGPGQLDVGLGLGSVTVYLPEDLKVDVSASVMAGDINLLGEASGGVGTLASLDELDEDLDLDLSVIAGEVRVVRE